VSSSICRLEIWLTNGRNETTETIAKSLEDMVRDCETVDFPQVRHDFSVTMIYWRKVEKATDV
jgi:hypothetical protein